MDEPFLSGLSGGMIMQFYIANNQQLHRHYWEKILLNNKMIYQHSLETLIDLSENPRLKHRLQCLIEIEVAIHLVSL